MVPKTKSAIKMAERDCKVMLHKRSLVSGAAGLSPIIGPDIVVDVAILIDLLSKINRRFGLSPEQIDRLDDRSKVIIFQLLKAAGNAIVGKIITQVMLKKLLKKVAIRLAIKSGVRFIPILGSLVSSFVSWSSMEYVGHLHIRECMAICEKYSEETGIKED